MGLPCGDTGAWDGGHIFNATISTSQITNSSFTGGYIDGANLVNIGSIDTNTARVILAAIMQLPKEVLAPLAELVAQQFPTTPVSPAPATDESPQLPTTVVGSKQQVLGKPSRWAAMGDYVVPLYEKGV